MPTKPIHVTTKPSSAMMAIPTPATVCISLCRGSLVLTRAELSSVVVERGLLLVVVVIFASEFKLVEGSVTAIIVFSGVFDAVIIGYPLVGSSDVVISE